MKLGLAALVILAVTPQWTAAADARAQFTVSAYVAPRVSLEVVSQPAVLSLSAADVARGYVDVTAVYRVQNNDPAGYLVRLEPRVGLARAIEVSGLATDVVVRDGDVEVLQPAALRAREIALSFRMRLDAAAVPGQYPLPVRVSAASL